MRESKTDSSIKSSLLHFEMNTILTALNKLQCFLNTEICHTEMHIKEEFPKWSISSNSLKWLYVKWSKKKDISNHNNCNQLWDHT